MPYYIEAEPETDFLKIIKPEEIRLLDPATGSGHMLTYSFDLLYLIYEEEGHAPSEIPGLILRHNLFGLEICSRATQLAQFALVCKAREKSRLAFRTPIQPQVMCLEDVKITSEEMTDYLRLPGLHELFSGNVLRQVHQFRENTSTFGSLIQPELTAEELTTLKSRLAMVNPGDDLLRQETHRKVLRALDQAEILTQRYHVVVANPPYMGGKQMNSRLKLFVEANFSGGKSDLYATFILRNLLFALNAGFIGMITIPNWMFLESFEDLRIQLLNDATVSTLIHNGRGLWGADFGSCAFSIHKTCVGTGRGSYKRLFTKPSEVNSPEIIEARFRDDRNFPWMTAYSQEFRKIPGYLIAYWISKRVRDAFSVGSPLSQFGDARQGLATADNERFLRLWFEPRRSRVLLNCTNREDARISGARWFPYNKGGAFRKWYGNSDYVIDWEYDGKELFSLRPKSVIRSPDKYFLPSLSWSKVTISSVSFRAFDAGYLFDVAGCSFFPARQMVMPVVAGYLNSSVVKAILAVLSPTMNYEVGHIAKLPVLERAIDHISGPVTDLVSEAIALARTDWDNFETSWDFRDQPLLRPGLKGATLEASWRNWETQNASAIRRMQELETENNRLFIDAYGLQDELTPDVPEEQITLARADARRDIAAFLPYSVGCMMGRYSLDQPGLILADAGDTLEHYLSKIGKPFDQLTFTPDADGVIPVLDREWFEDDIVARTRDFLRATFGVGTLEENVRFIEESLGKDLRKYFMTDFYKDHLQTYKKRPIYWLFQSQKKGFSALIYLHRYTRDTVNVLLNGYLRDFLHKLHSRIEHLEHVQATSESAREKTAARKESDALKKTLRECEEYEREIILPLAQQRIELDLDDGVKVNYLKFGKALATIPGLAAKEED